MKILLSGDTHGNIAHLVQVIDFAKLKNIETICVLGDFGFWEHTVDGYWFLTNLNDILDKNDINLLFIDGNHENHSLLREKYLGPHLFLKALFGEEYFGDFVNIRSRIYYIPRGTQWEWGGVSFTAVGGAYSIDRSQRKVGSSFWFEETLQKEEVEYIKQLPKTDVILSHDTSDRIDLFHMFFVGGRTFLQSVPSANHRSIITGIVDALEPFLLFHGHYHIKYQQIINTYPSNKPVHVYGLNCDGTGSDSICIINVENGFINIEKSLIYER